MCKNAYVACGNCNARADEYVRMRELRTEVLYYTLDEDGDLADHDCNGYGDQVDSEHDGYECSQCESTFQSLDMECMPEGCDCSECNPRIDNYEDGDAFCTLRRSRWANQPEVGDTIPELKALMEDRWLPYLLVRRERAEQIGELDWTDDFYWDFDEVSYTSMDRAYLTVPEPEQEVAA